jgi:hypothetical protein
MDGRGRFYDNIFIERLWRRNASCKESLKYELIYLMAFEDGIHQREITFSASPRYVYDRRDRRIIKTIDPDPAILISRNGVFQAPEICFG